MSNLRQSKKVIFQKQKPTSYVSLNSYYYELFRETPFEAPSSTPHNVFQMVKVPFYVEMVC